VIYEIKIMSKSITSSIANLSIGSDSISRPIKPQTSLCDEHLTVNKIFSSVHIEKDSDYITQRNQSFDVIGDVLAHRNTNPKIIVKLKRSLSCCSDDESRINKRRTFYKWSVPPLDSSQLRFHLKSDSC